MPAVRRPGKSYAPKSDATKSGAPRPAAAPRPGGPHGAPAPAAAKKSGDEHPILFQKFFKSANPQRTYAAQVKRASNGNHYLVLTEGKRDAATGEVRKTRLFLFGEDFKEFFAMLQATAIFIRENPVPQEIKQKRQRLWARKSSEAAASPPPSGPSARPDR